MTFTREAGVKWQNEVGKTSHMKVLMVHSIEDCEKECRAAAPCNAYTFIPGMEICALKAPNDAVTTVDAGMSATKHCTETSLHLTLSRQPNVDNFDFETFSNSFIQ